MGYLAESISSKLFNAVHGNNLVYNACWEDPRIDKEALELSKRDSVLVITSAGCNALSYALSGVSRVYAVDMNFRQNALLDLKIAGIKSLDYETFFKLFGEGRLDGAQQIYRDKLRALLPERSQQYWDRYLRKFFDSPDRSFYYCGASGCFASIIMRYMSVRGLKDLVDALIDAPDLETQRAVWKELRDKMWSRSLKFFVNRDLAMAMIGVPQAQRRQIEKSFQGLTPFVQKCLDEVCGELFVQDNYFWRAYVKGRYTKDCCPEYLTEEGFDTLKSGAVEVVSTHTNTVEGFLTERPNLQISRFVLLDHMDWLSGRLFKALEAEWQAILLRATPGARLIWRSAGLDATSFLHQVQVVFAGKKRSLGDLLSYRRETADRLHRLCRVHTYGSFYIADLLNE